MTRDTLPRRLWSQIRLAWLRWKVALGPEYHRLVDEPAFTGSCPVRVHTGDGHCVGRCEFATYDGFCPRHGALEDYPTNDDREVRVEDRRHA
jgi:hypothetical protein